MASAVLLSRRMSNGVLSLYYSVKLHFGTEFLPLEIAANRTGQTSALQTTTQLPPCPGGFIHVKTSTRMVVEPVLRNPLLTRRFPTGIP
jgi:hypothetical protein